MRIYEHKEGHYRDTYEHLNKIIKSAKKLMEEMGHDDYDDDDDEEEMHHRRHSRY